jgi:pimeloyl-ACP methyl ester carboxylesterase
MDQTPDRESDGFFSGLVKKYDDIWRTFILPERSQYNSEALGPEIRRVGEYQYIREDRKVPNIRGENLAMTFFRITNGDPARSKTCLVYLHSHGGSRVEGLTLMRHAASLGMNFCCFDFAGSGQSEGQFTTLGLRESDDCRSIVQCLQMNYKMEKFVLWGRSMGAVAALVYAAGNMPQLEYLVLDSPFSDVTQMVRDAGNNYIQLGEYVTIFLFNLVREEIKKHIGQDLGSFRPLDYCQQTTVPAVFVVAKQDPLVLPERVHELCKNYRGNPKEVLLIEGTHSSGRNQKDIDRILAVLNRHYKIAPTNDPHTKLSRQIDDCPQDEGLSYQVPVMDRIKQLTKEVSNMQRNNPKPSGLVISSNKGTRLENNLGGVLAKYPKTSVAEKENKKDAGFTIAEERSDEGLKERNLNITRDPITSASKARGQPPTGSRSYRMVEKNLKFEHQSGLEIDIDSIGKKIGTAVPASVHKGQNIPPLQPQTPGIGSVVSPAGTTYLIDPFLKDKSRVSPIVTASAAWSRLPTEPTAKPNAPKQGQLLSKIHHNSSSSHLPFNSNAEVQVGRVSLQPSSQNYNSARAHQSRPTYNFFADEVQMKTPQLANSRSQTNFDVAALQAITNKTAINNTSAIPIIANSGAATHRTPMLSQMVIQPYHLKYDHKQDHPGRENMRVDTNGSQQDNFPSSHLNQLQLKNGSFTQQNHLASFYHSQPVQRRDQSPTPMFPGIQLNTLNQVLQSIDRTTISNQLHLEQEKQMNSQQDHSQPSWFNSDFQHPLPNHLMNSPPNAFHSAGQAQRVQSFNPVSPPLGGNTAVNMVSQAQASQIRKNRIFDEPEQAGSGGPLPPTQSISQSSSGVRPPLDALSRLDLTRHLLQDSFAVGKGNYQQLPDQRMTSNQGVLGANSARPGYQSSSFAPGSFVLPYQANPTKH